MSSNTFPMVLILAGVIVTSTAASLAASHNYTDALSKCILFFEGQRSGKLPLSQRVTWRKDSALKDGYDVGMDLVGGYYDAGDNVKFNFPMAFTTTMMSWSVLEFGHMMGSDLQHSMDAIKWGTDYLLKATSVADSVVGVVGDPNRDHSCSQRPEDMDTLRTSYVVTKEKPGSEISAEIAAAFAASSMVFKQFDSSYSSLILNRSIQISTGGLTMIVLGKEHAPFTVISVATWMNFFGELLGFTRQPVHVPSYWKYVEDNLHHLESTVVRNQNGSPVPYITGVVTEFGWDSKHAGINILVSQWVMTSPNDSDPFIPRADQFVCSILPESPGIKSVTYSPGGLLFKPGGSNLQHSTALSFLLMVYAGYMNSANKTIDCGKNVVVTPARLVNFTNGQVDYILGSNPLGMSYMVGFGTKFPQKIHHRGSVLPSIDQHPQHIDCRGGDVYWGSQGPNLNLLTGAIVGGPAEDDTFEDSRLDVPQSEPTTYINAPFVGVLAYFKSSSS